MTALLRPSVDAQMLDLAEAVASRGTCSRLRVGAVVPLDQGRILVTGRNGAEPGAPHCFHAYDAPCLDSVHAERNLIRAAKARSLLGAIRDARVTVYVTHLPCEQCARNLTLLNPARVVYREEYRLTVGLDVFTAHGIRTEQHT